MKKLSQINYEEMRLSNLHQVRGGDGGTTYTGNQGSSGTDCYCDNDGDGKLSKGDDVLLDNGQWIVKK